jgi:hypothetical protein
MPQNALGYQIMEGKLFTQNQPQLQQVTTILIIIRKEAIIKN